STLEPCQLRLAARGDCGRTRLALLKLRPALLQVVRRPLRVLVQAGELLFVLPERLGERGHLSALDLDLLAQSRQLALSEIQLHRLRPQITLPLVEPAAFAVEPGESLTVRRGQPGSLVLAHGELGMAHLQRPAALL